MIKIESTVYPIIWQVSTDHLLPATSGQVRWNGLNKCFEVCDNQNGMWYRIDNTVVLRNDPLLGDVLEWAKKRMEFDRKVEKLAEKYPSVKDAKEQLDIVLALVADDNK